MPINGRNKGSAGEREAARFLEKILQLDYRPERNLEQVRSGGYDLLALPFIVEVKRCEVLSFRKWWAQVMTAKRAFERENEIEVTPIVLFRQNRQPWRLLISAQSIGLKLGYIILDNKEAKEWLKMKYSNT